MNIQAMFTMGALDLIISNNYVHLLPVSLQDNYTYISHTLVLKSPDGEWPITYTFTHLHLHLHILILI